jgi:hypothetical protein
MRLTPYQIAAIQKASHDIPVAFDFPVQRVTPAEIQAAMFFDCAGEQVVIQNKIDLEAYVRQVGKCYMKHKYFMKETVYELFLSKSI